MLRLTLIRHAKSAWDDPALDDFERPLNDRGRRDAPVMAQRLLDTRRAPDRLLSSPALRAITTARVFAAALGVKNEQIALDPRIYDASRKTLAEIVRGLDGKARHVAMFGHNPGFSELARWLATCPFSQLPTCAVAQLELQIGSWDELGAGCGRLATYLYPKDGAD